LLLAIERHYESDKQPEFVPNDNVDEVNLEHILPRRAKTSEWTQFSTEDVAFYSTKIGNMTLLKESKNNQIGNKPFSIKQTALASSAYKINSRYRNQLDWTKIDIDNRQLDFATIAPKVWSI